MAAMGVTMGFKTADLLIPGLMLYHSYSTAPIHYENTPMQYTVIFEVVKNLKFHEKCFDIFLIFAQNIRTHNLCFGAKVRKICIPLHTPVSLYRSGY